MATVPVTPVGGGESAGADVSGGRREYVSVVADSRRWDGFVMREGDIVISTPPKSGTTWTQMLVALLIFDGPDFPQPLNVLSPWMDLGLTPIEEIRQRLAAQNHRRVIKTHAPLDGLPMYDEVTYLMVGRDPRDVYFSMGQHMDNIDMDRQREAVLASLSPEELARRLESGEKAEDFLGSLELPVGTSQASVHLAQVLHHLWTGWERRDSGNVHLFHYRDLRADVVRETERLAAVLGYDYPPQRLAELAAHSDFENMRGQADVLAPDAHLDVWRSTTDFFRRARLDSWREELTAEEIERYAVRAEELYQDAGFLAWAHGGGAGGEWRR